MRSNIRKRLKFSLDVYNRGEFIGRYKTENIHIDGALIGITDTYLEPHDLLELKLYTRRANYNPLHIKGMIMHKSEKGVGVMFNYGEQVYDELRKILHSHRKYTQSRSRHSVMLKS